VDGDGDGAGSQDITDTLKLRRVTRCQVSPVGHHRSRRRRRQGQGQRQRQRSTSTSRYRQRPRQRYGSGNVQIASLEVRKLAPTPNPIEIAAVWGSRAFPTGAPPRSCPLDAVKAALRWFVIQAVAHPEPGDEAAQALSARLLAPIESWECSPRASAGATANAQSVRPPGRHERATRQVQHRLQVSVARRGRVRPPRFSDSRRKSRQASTSSAGVRESCALRVRFREVDFARPSREARLMQGARRFSGVIVDTQDA
jgi:hypothetical protein